MATVPQEIEIKIKAKVHYSLSLWQAIKLRIAGAAYKQVAEEIMKTLKEASNDT